MSAFTQTQKCSLVMSVVVQIYNHEICWYPGGWKSHKYASTSNSFVSTPLWESCSAEVYLQWDVYSVFPGDQMDINGKIREVLAETVRDDQGPARQSLSEADLLRALQRRGIIDDVMKDLHFTQVGQHFVDNFRIYILNDKAAFPLIESFKI